MVTYLGSLVRWCYVEGGTLQTNTADTCGECSQWMDHTVFATVHGSKQELYVKKEISLETATYSTLKHKL